MSIKILTRNAIDNTNIDGARQNHFSAGMRSGIVKGAYNEGNLFINSNDIALDSCELRISGHQVVIDSVEYITLSNAPSVNTQKSLFAEIVVNEYSTPTFRLFVEPSTYNLRQDNLFKDNVGNGTYQIEICTFLHRTDNTITDVVKTVNTITGGYGTGSESSIEDIKFNATAISLSSDSLPTANIDYNEDTKEYDLELGIPRGVSVPNTLTIGSVVGGDVASATITGDAPNQVLNLVIPKGEKGDKGEQGATGSVANAEALVDYDISKGTIEERLSSLGFKEGVVTLDSRMTTPYKNTIKRQGNCCFLKLALYDLSLILTSEEVSSEKVKIGTIPAEFRPDKIITFYTVFYDGQYTWAGDNVEEFIHNFACKTTIDTNGEIIINFKQSTSKVPVKTISCLYFYAGDRDGTSSISYEINSQN